MDEYVYVRDENKRVYLKDSNGRTTGGATEEGHWRKLKIVSETTRSYIDEWGNKHNKKTAITNSEIMNQTIWVKKNKYRIIEKLQRELDYNKLMRIQEILADESDV